MAPNQHGHHHDHFDSQTYAGDRATQAQRGQQHLPQEDRSSRAEIQAGIADSQSQQLASQGVRIGDDRAIGSPPNWEGMTSTQLHAAATRNNSPDTADSLGRAFNEGGNRLADAANRLLSAVGKLDAAWSGKAAESAKGALSPLAESAGQAGLAAQLMGAQMARQTAAASEVRKLPPPEEFDYQSELQTALANPNPVAGMADMKAKKDKADAVKREQVAYLNGYTQSMSAADSQMPNFIEPTRQISGGDGSRSHITGGSVNYVGPPGGGQLGRTSNQGTPPGPSGPWTGGGTGGELPGTGGQDFRPPPNLGGTGTSSYTPTPTTGPNLPTGGPNPIPPGAGQGGLDSSFGNFGAGPGQSGQAGRVPGGGPGGGGTGGPGRGLGTGGAPGVPGEHAGTAGRAGVGAGRGGPGMGGGSGAGARGDEDEEHERPSYLVEADPDATFGTDEVTAPPVIGQD